MAEKKIVTGRKTAVGLALEDTRGTAKMPTYFYPQLDFSFKDTPETKTNESAYNNITKNNAVDVMSVKGEGSIGGKTWAKGLYYWLALVFGQKATTTPVAGDTGAKKHLFSLNNENTHISSTVTIKEAVFCGQFPYAMIESFKISWTPDDYPKIEVSLMSKKSKDVTPSTVTIAYDSTETEFIPKDVLLKMAADAAGLAAAPELQDVKSFSLEIKKNLEAVQTSSSKDDIQEIFNKDFEVSGSIEKLYTDDTYKGMMLNGTTQAMQFGFIDKNHKAGNTTPTSLLFTISKVAISSREPSYGLSDISTETINFEGLLNITDGKTIEAELVNKYEY